MSTDTEILLDAHKGLENLGHVFAVIVAKLDTDRSCVTEYPLHQLNLLSAFPEIKLVHAYGIYPETLPISWVSKRLKACVHRFCDW